MKSLLPLAFLIASWQFSAAALAQTAIIPLGVEASSSIDGIDCIESRNQTEEPSPLSDNSSDSTSDLDESDGTSADTADIVLRLDPDPPHFAGMAVEAVTLRTPQTMRILFLPTRCCDCLQDHIRERAPPAPDVMI
jgi:hypothetical protein